MDRQKQERINNYQKQMVKCLLSCEKLPGDELKLVVMAPTKGKTEDKDNYSGIRIYSNGGLLAEIKRTKTRYLSKAHDEYINAAFPDKTEFIKFKADLQKYNGDNDNNKEEIKPENLSKKSELEKYRSFIEGCVKVTEKWAEGEKSGEGKESNAARQEHNERRIETDIIYYWRKKDAGMKFIDMEFNLFPWKEGGRTEYGKLMWQYPKGENVDFQNNRGGRVDLVIYIEGKGFGLLELKYQGASVENIGKHCADFDAAIKNEKCDEIISELKDRMTALQSIGILENSASPVEEKLWYGFLLIGGESGERCISEGEYVKIFENDENWECEEQRSKVKCGCEEKRMKVRYRIDWKDIRKKYKKSGNKNDPVFIYSKTIENINKAGHKSYNEFITAKG